MQEDERRQRLIGWLRTIKGELQSLAIDNHIFKQLQELIRLNPRFASAPGLFNQWMVSGYVHAAALGIRRQTKSRDSESLMRFLDEVRKYPGLISRAHYLDVPANPVFAKEIGPREFARIACSDGSHVNVALVEGHIVDLLRLTEGIEHYADRRLAHYDGRGLAMPAPTFGDVDACLAVMETIFRFYYLYLERTYLSELLPTFQYDWQEIFDFRWRERTSAG